MRIMIIMTICVLFLSIWIYMIKGLALISVNHSELDVCMPW